MGVFRINKDNNYSVMSNYHLRDKNLSFKAMGLLSFMLSNDENWDYSVQGLVSCVRDGERSVESAIKELKNAGYLRVTKLYADETESGRIEYIYDIFETPQILEVQNVALEILPLENDLQRNTNKRNTKEEDKLDKLDISSEDDNFQNEIFSKLSNLTIQLIKRKFISIDDMDLFKYDKFLSEQLDNCKDVIDYKMLITVISYIIARMKKEQIESPFAYFKTSVVENLSKLAAINESSTEELYSEEYCNNLLNEFNLSNGISIPASDLILDDLEELYESITNIIPERSAAAP